MNRHFYPRDVLNDELAKERSIVVDAMNRTRRERRIDRLVDEMAEWAARVKP